ncbi:hypothetical protein ACFL6S_23065 [Candidatus Poribacteria bacterium]
MFNVVFSKDYIAKVLEFLGHREAGGVTEVRIFPKNRYIGQKYVGNVVSGYYNDYERLARDIEPFDGKANIYVTINPCIPDLLARAANRLQFGAKVATGDRDILCDLWFMLDFDPVRPSGISSTDAELHAALAKRDEVAEFLSSWAPVVKGMSGNGGHGLVRLPGYANSEKTRRAKERLIRFFSEQFSEPIVSVDKTVFNMSRLIKLYGTIACKGDSVESRPHRRSHLDISPVDTADLYAHLDEIIPSEYGSYEQGYSAGSGDYPVLNVQHYLNSWGGAWRMRVKDGVRWYQFRICPLHTDYDGHRWECGICQFDSGKMGAKCMHEPSYGWQDFKAILGNPREFYQQASELLTDLTNPDY